LAKFSREEILVPGDKGRQSRYGNPCRGVDSFLISGKLEEYLGRLEEYLGRLEEYLGKLEE
jgi:hypothetical protein